MSDKVIGFIGLGLIGGSIAKGIKRACPDIQIMAYMRTRSKLEQAQRDGIVDVILDGVGEDLRVCDMIFLCTPVEYNARYLSELRPFLKKGAVVTDVGSTKANIHQAVRDLGMEECFVGGHPMAGSEKTGYENASDHLLENAYYVITPTPFSRQEDVDELVRLAKLIGAIPIVLDFARHDQTVAAISRRLSLSENTIRSHSKAIYRKLDVHSKQELIDLVANFQSTDGSDNAGKS